MRRLLNLIQYRRVCQNVQRRIEELELRKVEQRVQERMQTLFNTAV